MNDEIRDRLTSEMITRPEERQRILRAAELTDEDREELAGIVATAEALWLSAQDAPALADDPVAAMLGLLPDGECRLSSAALSRARKRARLSVSDVAARLLQRDWQFDKNDVFRWETRTATEVPPAVIQALAEILDSQVDDLLSAPSPASLPDHLDKARTNPLFGQLVNRWALARRVSHAVAAATLESRMLSTVHRGEHPDAEQMLRSLDALVTSVEQADQQ